MIYKGSKQYVVTGELVRRINPLVFQHIGLNRWHLAIQSGSDALQHQKVFQIIWMSPGFAGTIQNQKKDLKYPFHIKGYKTFTGDNNMIHYRNVKYFTG